MSEAVLDPKWPYTKRHRKVHLKQSAKEVREQQAALVHRLVADAWDMPLEEEVRERGAVDGQRIMALEADLARLEVMMESVLREGEMKS